MQIKMTQGFLLTPNKFANVKKANKTNAAQDAGKKGILIHYW
jgi:hypothetical protein